MGESGGLLVIGNVDDEGNVVYSDVGNSSSAQLRGLVDIFTGNELLSCEYKEIVIIENYVYSNKDGEWTIYKAEMN